MLKAFRVLTILSLIMIMFTGTASALEKETNEVTLIVNNNFQKIYTTQADNVGQFLEEIEFVVTPRHEISAAINSTIRPNMEININEMINTKLIIDGVEKKEAFVKSTVEKMVEDYSRKTGFNYSYDETISDKIISEFNFIELNTIVSKIFNQTEVIPFETEKIQVSGLNTGEEVIVTKGVEGEKKKTFKVDYIGGVEVSRTLTEEVISKEPVKQIINIPKENVIEVKTASDIKELKYKKEYTMNASAYTADYNSTGKSPDHPAFGITASGMKAKVGVVAVDPNVIPLGTKLFIEGYGEAIAGDTGGAIKGHKIDLFYNTNQECREFGRRNVKVYVLE